MNEKHNHCNHSHHGHSHSHDHEITNFGKEFIVAISLNSIFVLVEFFYGILTNSTALMADAGHNLSDVLGLFLAWGAFLLSKKVPDKKFTYGFRSSSIFSSIFNAMLLLFACGAIAWEATQRLIEPQEVAGMTITIVSMMGVVINGISAWLFFKGSSEDINIKGAYLHLLSDAMISVGVAISGLIIKFTSWYWIDPLSSLIIISIIIYGTWGLLKESIHFALNAVPKNIDIEAVEQYLSKCDGVEEVHDLHIWGMSTTESALTVHLVIPNGYVEDGFIENIAQKLKQNFKIQHSTIQIEKGTIKHNCTLH